MRDFTDLLLEADSQAEFNVHVSGDLLATDSPGREVLMGILMPPENTHMQEVVANNLTIIPEESNG
jgi:hypothetical protein